MKTKTLIIIGMILTVIVSTISLSLVYNQEIKISTGMMNSDEKPQPSMVSDPVCFVTDRSSSGETGSGVTMDRCFTLSEFEEMGCTEPMLEHLAQYSNLLDYEYEGMWYMDFIGLPDGMAQEKFDECVDIILEKRPIMNSKSHSPEQQCANSYNFMQTKITQIRQTDFLSVSDYVQDIDTLLEIKKDIQRLDCESTAYQWIHLATNTQKISDPSEIVIQRTYDNVRTITNNQLVIPQYVVPWKILDYLQQHGIEFTNAPSNNAIQTDEGWRDPTRLCSQLLFTNGTQFYASATFHPDPLSVTGIFVDLERPTDCQKYFPIPRGFQ